MVKIHGILGVSWGILCVRAPVRAHHARQSAHDLARQLLWNCFGTTLGPSPHPHVKSVLCGQAVLSIGMTKVLLAVVEIRGERVV